jgi:hypothetical protein
MNYKKTIVALTVVMMAFISLSAVAGEDSDAIMAISDNPRAEGFANNSNGTLTINFNNTDGVETEIRITVTDLNNPGTVYTSQIVTVPDGKNDIRISFRIGDAGSHEVLITCEPQELFHYDGTKYLNQQTMTINVSKSIWSNTTTYIAIAAIAILIVIAAVIRMRSVPATKPDTTFTELERQKESRSDDDDEDVPQTTSRRKYNEEKPAPAPVQKETKATSFTELEKNKAEPKPKTKTPKEGKKESSSEEPKKLKYVSSRRK